MAKGDGGKGAKALANELGLVNPALEILVNLLIDAGIDPQHGNCACTGGFALFFGGFGVFNGDGFWGQNG